MALKMFTGFETGDVPEGWSLGASATVTGGSSRSGSGAYGLNCPNLNEVMSNTYTWTVASERIYLGFAMQLSAAASGTTLVCVGADYDATSRYFATLLFNSNGSVALYAGDSTYGTDSLLGTSSAGDIQTTTWHYVELNMLFDDTAGAAQVHIDGVQKINVTSTDTAVDGNANRANANDLLVARFRSQSAGLTVYYDDVYLCTDTAAGNDPFTGRQGDIQVEALKPTADTAQKDFSTTETNNYQAIEDVPITTAQYNSSSTSAHEDRFTLANRTHTGTPLGVAYHVAGEKDAANPQQINALLTSGGTKDSKGPFALAESTSKTFSSYYAVNPDTGLAAWTNTSVNAIEIGYDVD